MDLKGSISDTNLKIYPTENFINFIKTIKVTEKLPHNITQIIKAGDKGKFDTYKNEDVKICQLNDADINTLKKINKIIIHCVENDENENEECKHTESQNKDVPSNDDLTKEEENFKNKYGDIFIVTADLDWLYDYLKNKRNNGEKDIPYLHSLLEGAYIKLPENEIIKRNPVLEARCVKLRSQQEAREYRKMTKGVDNVRMRFPEDSISYQLKQLNRQLIAIGQFIISIFAGFLFGFKGVEWMVGNLDFGFRLLLGVMCALVIAIAEIYFLAKKLNEELCIPETVQLGGPPKFADQEHKKSKLELNKQHQD